MEHTSFWKTVFRSAYIYVIGSHVRHLYIVEIVHFNLRYVPAISARAIIVSASSVSRPETDGRN